ncbi:protein of unknown function DUF2605 [Cyanobacterium sp. HL-69]|uniref:DUF2605 domain-containing protein n=1 Tax=Cyanobacterium sp. HL-69 TaxID=2054282 RepID=UPI000CA20346|nr:protein of unknown function DUF2605 [Cyanobacterium sp. HL-69]
MQPSQPTERELLAKVLAPLLEDFKYWFSRSITLLESERITFLSEEEQNDLIARIKNSQEEVKTASMLFKATDGRAGIDTKVLMPWHSLVGECWSVARRWRKEKELNQN